MVFGSCRVAIHERVGKAIRNPPRDVMLSHACLGLDYLLTARIPPRRPNSAAALSGARAFFLFNCPVAILATMTAAPITSAGRFSPRGPLGIVSFHLGNERRDAGDLRSLFLRRVRP
jgi:hypothetical protein